MKIHVGHGNLTSKVFGISKTISFLNSHREVYVWYRNKVQVDNFWTCIADPGIRRLDPDPDLIQNLKNYLFG
jgi:hypothetical protein